MLFRFTSQQKLKITDSKVRVAARHRTASRLVRRNVCQVLTISTLDPRHLNLSCAQGALIAGSDSAVPVTEYYVLERPLQVYTSHAHQLSLSLVLTVGRVP